MERDTPNQRVGIDQRAQSVFDFSIGVSLFLVVVLGVLVFIPTAFGSFTSDAGGGVGDGIAADKAAAYLADSALTNDSAPSKLDSDCTLLFFTETSNHPDVNVGPPDCGLQQAVPLASNASLDFTRISGVESSRVSVNVTIERGKPTDPGRERLCWDADASLSGNRLKPIGHGACDPSMSDDVKLTAGASAARNDNYAVAHQYTRLGDEGVYLVVRTW